VQKSVAAPVQKPVEPAPYLPIPTPDEIYKKVYEATSYERKWVGKLFVGNRVRWRVKLYSVQTIDDRLSVCFKQKPMQSPLIVASFYLAEYPILKTVKGGEPVEIIGTIGMVQDNASVALKDAKITFL
jgi:hypothetical protein